MAQCSIFSTSTAPNFEIVVVQTKAILAANSGKLITTRKYTAQGTQQTRYTQTPNLFFQHLPSFPTAGVF